VNAAARARQWAGVGLAAEGMVVGDGVLPLLPGQAHDLGAELAGEVHQPLLDIADLHAKAVELGLAGVDHLE